MVRLTDLIKQGSVPEKTDPPKKEGLSFKDILAPEIPQEIPQEISPEIPKEEQSSQDLKPSLEEKIEEGCHLYEEMVDFIRVIKDKIEKGEAFTVERGFELIQESMEAAENIETLYYSAFKPRDVLDFMVFHPVNVSIFALKMGGGLEYDRPQQVKLGMAALLLDIGMYKVSQEILCKQGSLLPSELGEILRHTKYGYELIFDLGEAYHWLAEIILQSHEREDGSGYPQGLKGKETHEYAKIIGVADTFGALVHARPYRRRLFPYEAVKEVIESKKKQFSPRVLKVLIQEMSVFPMYSYVKLNSGVIGRVVATERNHPLRPTIEVVSDFAGKKPKEPKIISLMENPLLNIVEPVNEAEVE